MIRNKLARKPKTMTALPRIPAFSASVLILTLLHVTAAFAANRIIEIRQIDPPGERQATVCKEFDAKCQVAIEINATDTHQPERITVTIESTPSGTDFRFKSDSQDVFLEEGSLLRMDIGKSGRAKETVSLLRSAYGEEGLAKQPVLRGPGEAFAQLEITVLPLQ